VDAAGAQITDPLTIERIRSGSLVGIPPQPARLPVDYAAGQAVAALLASSG
jgi:hypothetical protein